MTTNAGTTEKTGITELLEGPLLPYPSLGDLMDTAMLGMERDIWEKDGMDAMADHGDADPRERTWSLTTGAQALETVPMLRPALYGVRERARLADFCGLHPQEVMERMGPEMFQGMAESDLSALRDLLRENLRREKA